MGDSAPAKRRRIARHRLVTAAQKLRQRHQAAQELRAAMLVLDGSTAALLRSAFMRLPMPRRRL